MLTLTFILLRNTLNSLNAFIIIDEMAINYKTYLVHKVIFSSSLFIFVDSLTEVCSNLNVFALLHDLILDCIWHIILYNIVFSG